jgi:hypothetical protein
MKTSFKGTGKESMNPGYIHSELSNDVIGMQFLDLAKFFSEVDH